MPKHTVGKTKARINRYKVAYGGAAKRKHPSLAARFIHTAHLDVGRTLDFGCGYGLDADVYGWDAYDPHYRDVALTGTYDTIVCINVLSAVSAYHRATIFAQVKGLLSDTGVCYFALPRNLPRKGKLSGHHRRPQYHVTLNLETVHTTPKFEIVRMRKTDDVVDTTLS